LARPRNERSSTIRLYRSAWPDFENGIARNVGSSVQKSAIVPPMKLVIGNKNYSSWSLRAWLVLRQAEIPFEEETLRFGEPNFAARASRYSPTARVPVLVDGEVTVWDSLAIAEYVSEKFPHKRLWPEDRVARAHARSICAEMHAGFAALRRRMPMNCTASLPLGMLELAVRRDVDRIADIWREARERYAKEGPFLFGRFSIADAFFAPVVWRFVTYATPLPPAARAYLEMMTQLSSMNAWLAGARAENEFVIDDEPYREKP
jgi:glutathione S-transferase